jgi:hypothetical protein
VRKFFILFVLVVALVFGATAVQAQPDQHSFELNLGYQKGGDRLADWSAWAVPSSDVVVKSYFNNLPDSNTTVELGSEVTTAPYNLDFAKLKGLEFAWEGRSPFLIANWDASACPSIVMVWEKTPGYHITITNNGSESLWVGGTTGIGGALAPYESLSRGIPPLPGSFDIWTVEEGSFCANLAWNPN